MELRQLEYFVAVAEEANFTRAAARVHISQSGISAQIRRLEGELGETLFDRSERTVRLTRAGETVLPHARAALGAVEEVGSAIDQLTGLVRGQVTVGMVNGCSIPIMVQLLAEFHGRYPGVAITLSEDGSDRLVQLLNEGRIDLALIGSAGASVGPSPEIGRSVLVEEALVVAMTPGNPLASHRSITVDQLRGQPLVCLPRGTGVRTALDLACADAGFEARITLEASALPMVAQLALFGLGAAVLPSSTAHAHPGLHVLTFDGPDIRSRLELAWSPDSTGSPAARALVTHTAEFLQRTESGVASSTLPGPSVPVT
jgi:DNA-binding transcriptional LysR family regulator